MGQVRFVGADGCKAGRWACVVIDKAGSASFDVLDSARAIVERFPSAERIVLDVPIGLQAGGSWRTCDLEAKRILGRANSRVFLTAPRRVLECADWAEANAMNRELTGHGLSKQSWAIVPRVREVDALMQTMPAARVTVRECHPEICVWGLTGGADGGIVAPGKKSEEGRQFRLQLVERFIPESRRILSEAMGRWPRKLLSSDDVVDAMICAVTAASPESLLRTLPGQMTSDLQFTPAQHSEQDATGVRKEMLYRLEAPTELPATPRL